MRFLGLRPSESVQTRAARAPHHQPGNRKQVQNPRLHCVSLKAAKRCICTRSVRSLQKSVEPRGGNCGTWHQVRGTGAAMGIKIGAAQKLRVAMNGTLLLVSCLVAQWWSCKVPAATHWYMSLSLVVKGVLSSLSGLCRGSSSPPASILMAALSAPGYS